MTTYPTNRSPAAGGSDPEQNPRHPANGPRLRPHPHVEHNQVEETQVPTDGTTDRGVSDRGDAERPAADRVLQLAEVITRRSTLGAWERNDYPTADRMAAELNAMPEEVNAALDALTWRGVLVAQHDPALGNRMLPAPNLAKRKSAARLADRIALRLKLGLWGPANFPNIETIVRELSVSAKTVVAAMQMLKDDGLVHKVAVRFEAGGRVRALEMWQPAEVKSQALHDIAPLLREAIATGELGPILPNKVEAAARYRVAIDIAAQAYDRLREEGVIDVGWLAMAPQHRRVWYVVGAKDLPSTLFPGELRFLAVASMMVKDLPNWLVMHRDGTWFRQALPNQKELTSSYRAHEYEVERAAELLVLLKILERPPLADRVYLPRPPLDSNDAHGLTFRTVGKRPARPWAPAREAVQWLPMPASVDDDNARLVLAVRPRGSSKKRATPATDTHQPAEPPRARMPGTP